jgi:NAD(P)H-dependent flavin oxidoreductase YrpB (nitropropane dioxygenase family)
MPLLALLPAVRDVVGDRLVLGAGGIADGRTAAAVLASGADGIMLGTRLVATSEANAHDEYKRRLVEASGEDTVITHVYGPERPALNPMRIIRNQTVTSWQNRLDEIPKNRADLKPIGQNLFASQQIAVKPFDSIVPVRETSGDFEQMPILAGQGVRLINKVVSANEIIKKLMNEAVLVVESFETG